MIEHEQDRKEWALKIEQAKGETNLERARSGEPTLEKLPEVEFSGVYKDSRIADKIRTRIEQGQHPLALFTDIDNTFYRGDQIDAMHKLDRLIEKEKMGKVYITGRDQPMVESQANLPKADIVAGAVGTEIYVLNKDGKYELDEEFRQLLLNTWDRKNVYQQAKALTQQHPQLVFQPRDVPGAYEHGDTKQPPQEFKISFHLTGKFSDMEQMVKLLEKNIPGARAIGSTDIHDPQKFNIDLLPIHAGKELAIQYLCGKLGLKGFTAGDSGNDISMLVEGGNPSILVGGAREEAKAIVLSLGKTSPRGDIREFPYNQQIQKVFVGKDKYDDAAQGIINALTRGDFNPENAVQFVNSLYQLHKKPL